MGRASSGTEPDEEQEPKNKIKTGVDPAASRTHFTHSTQYYVIYVSTCYGTAVRVTCVLIQKMTHDIHHEVNRPPTCRQTETLPRPKVNQKKKKGKKIPFCF